MLFESSSVSLDSDSGNVWWYHSELTYSTEVVDGIAGIHSANEGVSNVPVNLTKNIVQWVPFGPVDVVHLENCFREYQKEKELVADDGTGNVNNKAGRDGNCDEFKCPKRFVAVKRDSSQYLKVDLERMRMGPIYWAGEEYFVRRSTWYCVPDGAKKIEGFPVPAELDSMLTARYEETREWIDGTSNSDKCNIDVKPVGKDDTIVEKIVPLSGDTDDDDCIGSLQPKGKSSVMPAVIDPYFLVFRQHSHDYARLCIERPLNGSGGGSFASKTRSSSSSGNASKDASTESLPPSPVVAQGDLQSRSTSPSYAAGSKSPGGGSEAARSPKLLLDSRSCESARLYRTYASFFHAVAGGSTVKSSSSGSSGASSAATTISSTKTFNVQTQMQSNSDPRGEDAANKQSGSSSASKTAKSSSMPSSQSNNGNRPAQKHSFKAHPLPSPELPAIQPRSIHPGVKHVIFVVHGVGQRVWRKMGLSFNKDCDELRNVLEEAGVTRGLAPGSITVLPVSWRSELDLAGNFTFGDEDDEDEDLDEDGKGEPDGIKSDELLVDSHDILTVSSVFKGQFTEILERLALDSIPAVRSVLSDATMDILLYVSPKHFDRILGAVRKEVLRLYKLFMHWNPGFTGGFSFVAHSLGSALVADLLSWTLQPDDLIARLDGQQSGCCRSDDSQKDATTTTTTPPATCIGLFKELGETESALPFVVDKFFAMGSPLGVFHLLKHTKPVGCARSPHIEAALQERVRKWRAARARTRNQRCGNVPLWTVYNCRLFYNLFHPHDPVAHRFESLILLSSNGGRSAVVGRGRFSSLSLSNYNSSAASAVSEPGDRERTAAMLHSGRQAASSVDSSFHSCANNPSTNKTNNNNNNTCTLPPPLKIPYHKSGFTRFTMDLEAKISRAKNEWSLGLKKIASWFGSSGAGKTAEEEEEKEKAEAEGVSAANANATANATATAIESLGSTSSLVTESASASVKSCCSEPLSAFNHNFNRVDFALQDSFIENPYLSALSAHFNYWPDLDIASFIVSELIKDDLLERRMAAESESVFDERRTE